MIHEVLSGKQILRIYFLIRIRNWCFVVAAAAMRISLAKRHVYTIDQLPIQFD